MYSFWMLFLVFTAYSFLGWLTESLFCSIPTGKFINRGFLNGPFCPVYGLGGILVITILSPFKDNIAVLYFSGVIITSLLEYITGFALEKIFHTKYWDYSNNKYNIQGRVCLENSLLFGVMSVIGILYIHPSLMRLFNLIPKYVLPFISLAFLIYFIIDTVITVKSIYNFNIKLDEMQIIINELKDKVSYTKLETIENLQSAISNLINYDCKTAYIKSLFEKKNKIESEVKLYQKRMINAFPSMKSFKNNESLQRIKKNILYKTKSLKK